MIGRIERSADFERVLRTPQRARSAHFAVHHLSGPPQRPRLAKHSGDAELSTAHDDRTDAPVEEAVPVVPGSARLWLGVVVPKRHARRSVTRTLVKREIRAAVAERRDALSGGLWVVRLRAPLDRAAFPSAASAPLRSALRAELYSVLSQAAARR